MAAPRAGSIPTPSASASPPLRLAIVNPIRAYGGGEKWVVRAALGLLARGHAVTVLAHPDGELLRICREQEIPARPLLLRHDVSPAGVLSLARELRSLRVDTFICCNERSVRLGVVAARLPGHPPIPVVYRNGLQGCFKDKAHNRLLVAPRVARFVVNAEATRQELLALGWVPKDHVRLIYNGVDPAPVERADPSGLREALGAAPNHVVALIAARMMPEKGHALLLDAVSRLGAAGERLRLWIAGEGPEEERIRAKISELRLGDRVRMLGFRKDVPRLLRAADLLSHPSEREGAPNVVLEAMTAGLPVVGVAAPGTAELVVQGQTGLLSPPGDAEALAASLRSLVEDVVLRRKLGEAGRARALGEFTEERSTDRWEALLREAAAGT